MSVRVNVARSLIFVETIAPDFSSFPSQGVNFTYGYVLITGTLADSGLWKQAKPVMRSSF